MALSLLQEKSSDVFDRIVNQLEDKGYLVFNNVFQTEVLNSLLMDIKAADSAEFHVAGIGREDEQQVNPFIRNDRIQWLDKNRQAARFYFDWMEALRLHLNRELFLGLFDYECHYAHYQKGAFYKKHLDAFKGSSNRVLTTILYLNPNWQSEDGGELVLYAADGDIVLEKVQPTFGSMVIFLSEEFPHEVLPANRSRYSLTGWFRVNNTSSFSLDPSN